MQHFSGREYLLIDLANHFGFDKLSWKERIAWSEKALKDYSEPQMIKYINQKADEPVEAYAAYQAILEAMDEKPIGYAISLDATSSGAQILSCLCRDEKAAKLCNVIPTGNREDLYTNIYQIMKNEIDDSLQVTRKDIKQAIMTALYGSKAVPKMVFQTEELLESFQNIMMKNLPLCWEFNEYLLDIWNPQAYEYNWIMPDLFYVHLEVMDKITDKFQFANAEHYLTYEVNLPIKQGRFLSADIAHSIDGYFVREMIRRCMYSPRKVKWICKHISDKGSNKREGKLFDLIQIADKTGIWSYRILDLINKDNIASLSIVEKLKIMTMIDSLPENPFQVYTIHDCFKCLPNHGNEVRKIYNSLLAELWNSELLNYLVSSILGYRKYFELPHLDMRKQIIESDYALS